MSDRLEQPQKSGPQGNVAYATLLQEIREGHLLPGDRLLETEIADRLKISRTPVREAIRQLEADGLVAHVPRHGATIRKLDYTEVMELYEMRAVLEGTAARLAARAASDIELEELEALNTTLAKVKDPDEASQLNRRFHVNLLDAAKNRFLTRSMQTIQKAMMLTGPTMLADEQRAIAAVEEHARIMDALIARDGDAAETAMRNHIEAAQRLRIRNFRERVVGLDDT